MRSVARLLALLFATAVLLADVKSGLGGSATLAAAPLVAAWLDGFARSGGAASLSGPPGPPQGKLDAELERFLEHRTDFAFLTRDIAEADLATYRRTHPGDPVVIAVANGAWNGFGLVDPVVVIVNRANPLRAITFRQLDGLLSRTRWRGGPAIARWADLGVQGWGDAPIHVKGGEAWAAEESARALTVRRRVLSLRSRRGEWRLFLGSGRETDVVADVAADPLGIGLTGLGHLAAGVRPLALAAEGGRPTPPTRAAISAGRYPLARTVDLLLPRAPDGCLNPRAQRFAAWLLSPAGQALVRRQGTFLPLTADQLRDGRQRLACLRRS